MPTKRHREVLQYVDLRSFLMHSQCWKTMENIQHFEPPWAMVGIPNLRAVVCFNEIPRMTSHGAGAKVGTRRTSRHLGAILACSWANKKIGIIILSLIIIHHYCCGTTMTIRLSLSSLLSLSVVLPPSLSLSIAICQNCQPQRWACIECIAIVSSLCSSSIISCIIDSLIFIGILTFIIN